MNLVRLAVPFLAVLFVAKAADERKVMMAKPTPDQINFFESKVRPVLAENCFRCHGGDPKKEPKAGLILTTLKGMLQGGESGPALLPGNLDKSRIVEAIRYRNENMSMPPKKPLDEAFLNYYGLRLRVVPSDGRRPHNLKFVAWPQARAG